ATFWFSRKVPDCCSRRSTRVVLPWSTWAMMATLRRFMAVLLVNGVERDRAENRDPYFCGRTLESVAAQRGQKGSPAKGPGDSLRVAAQYIQKMLKNNGLFGVWLAEFGGKISVIPLQNCHQRRPRMALTISITPPAPMNRPSAIRDPMSDGKLRSLSAMPPKMSAQRPGRSRMIPAMIMNAVRQPLRCCGGGNRGGPDGMAGGVSVIAPPTPLVVRDRSGRPRPRGCRRSCRCDRTDCRCRRG